MYRWLPLSTCTLWSFICGESTETRPICLDHWGTYHRTFLGLCLSYGCLSSGNNVQKVEGSIGLLPGSWCGTSFSIEGWTELARDIRTILRHPWKQTTSGTDYQGNSFFLKNDIHRTPLVGTQKVSNVSHSTGISWSPSGSAMCEKPTTPKVSLRTLNSAWVRSSEHENTLNVNMGIPSLSLYGHASWENITNHNSRNHRC